jgi:hypothetical protein
MSFPAGESWKSLTTSPTASASCDFPISFRDPQLAQDISNQKTNRGLPGRTSVAGAITPSNIL